MKTTTLGTYQYWSVNIKILIYLDKEYFGYEFSSIIVEKSTRKQVTGYELTFPLLLRLDFQGTG